MCEKTQNQEIYLEKEVKKEVKEEKMNKTPAAEISRETRSTSQGAYDDAFVYSIKEKRELAPHRQKRSRTGNHGEKTWHLLPGMYIEAHCNISNSGKGGWRVVYLLVDINQQELHRPMKELPEWLRPLLPADCLREIEPCE